MTSTHVPRYKRYVAVGDSSTEGLRDYRPDGSYQGWSRRLAQRLADHQGGLTYANFGVRGKTTRQILQAQVPHALSMNPDLVTMFSGTNDVLRREWDLPALERDMEKMQSVFIENGATVLTFTLPDLTPIMPLARFLAPRIRAMNKALHETTKRTGAILLDFAAYPVATDPRLWDVDRIHANADGHARIANALAYALQLPGSDETWRMALPGRPVPTVRTAIQNEVSWVVHYLLPWLGKRMRSQPRRPKRSRPPVVLETVIPHSGVEI